jgi:hypothetical protein
MSEDLKPGRGCVLLRLIEPGITRTPEGGRKIGLIHIPGTAYLEPSGVAELVKKGPPTVDAYLKEEPFLPEPGDLVFYEANAKATWTEVMIDGAAHVLTRQAYIGGYVPKEERAA